jgi:hypothetical protein
MNGGADPLVRTVPVFVRKQVHAAADKLARGPAADEGVRPTIDADDRN